MNIKDFDGDELNCTILGDNMMAEEAASLDTHLSVPGLSDIAEVSSDISLPKPCVATLSNYLLKEDTVETSLDTITKHLETVAV